MSNTTTVIVLHFEFQIALNNTVKSLHFAPPSPPPPPSRPSIADSGDGEPWLQRILSALDQIEMLELPAHRAAVERRVRGLIASRVRTVGRRSPIGRILREAGAAVRHASRAPLDIDLRIQSSRARRLLLRIGG